MKLMEHLTSENEAVTMLDMLVTGVSYVDVNNKCVFNNRIYVERSTIADLTDTLLEKAGCKRCYNTHKVFNDKRVVKIDPNKEAHHITIWDIVESKDLTQRGALCFIESLLTGTACVEANGVVCYAYGSFPQAVWTIYGVYGFTSNNLSDVVEELDEEYMCCSEQPFEELKLFAKLMKIELIDKEDVK